MCWEKFDGGEPRKRIAKEDIICFKRVRILSRKRGTATAWIYPERMERRPYKLNKISAAHDNFGKVLSLRPVEHYGIISGRKSWGINAGIHSYRVKDPSKGINMKCVIPKGTEFYQNAAEYVSLTIKPIIFYKRLLK